MAVTRGNAGKGSRQKVRLRQDVGEFDGKSLPNLARQVKATFNNLLASLSEGAGELLQIIDGTTSPKTLFPFRDKLEFAGRVTLESLKDRIRVVIDGFNAVESLDGVVLDEPTSGTVRGRASRKELIGITFSTAQTSYAPADALSATTWDLCDFANISANGGTSAARTVNSFAAPTAAGTTVKELFNGGTLPIIVKLLGSGTGPIIGAPGTTDVTMEAGEGFLIWWSPTGGGYYLISRKTGGVTDHGSLTGLADEADHPYATLIDGTRDFTGDQSMGDNKLTSVNQIVMSGSTTNALLMNGTSIQAVDDITANSSGAVWNLLDGNMVRAAYVGFTNNSVSGTPNSGDMRFGTVGGIPHYRMGVKALHRFPACFDYQEAKSTGTALADFTINFASIDGGRDMSDGAWTLELFAYETDTSSGTDSHWEWRIFNVKFTSGAPTGVTVTERLFDDGGGVGGPFQSLTTTTYGSVTASGQVVTITRNYPFGSSINLLHYVLVTGIGR